MLQLRREPDIVHSHRTSQIMLLLIIGLIVFLGIHAINLINPGLRQQMIDKRGRGTWRVVYSIIALVGLVLIIIGYGQARMDPTWLWFPPAGLRHLALIITLVAFVRAAATYVSRIRIKSKLGHPMYAGIKAWALAHLLANGSLADVLLFGSFLAWAIAGFAIQRRRDRAAGVVRPAGTFAGDALTIVAGVVVWAVFVGFLHTWLIGVSPLP